MKIFKNINPKKSMIQEVNILRELNTSYPLLGIPKFYECFYNEDETQFGYFMEKINGITLYEYINNKIADINNDNDIYNFIYEVIDIHKGLISIIETLHENVIFHRDIHMGNIIYDNITKKIRLIDFGHACTTRNITEYRCKQSPTSKTRIYLKQHSKIGIDNDIYLENRLIDYLGCYHVLKESLNFLTKKIKKQIKKLRFLTLINGLLVYFNYEKQTKYDNNDIENMIELISLKNTKINRYKDVNVLLGMDILQLHLLGKELGLYLDITNNTETIINEILNSEIIIYNNIDKRIISKFTSNSMGCNINIKPPNHFISEKYRLDNKLNIISVSIFKKNKTLGRKYLLGFASIVTLFHKIYPNFILRIYYDSSISNDRDFNNLKIELKLYDFVQFARYSCPYQQNNIHNNLFGSISRFFVLGENDVGNVFFRDIDFIPHKHDHDMMMNFINSNAYFHQITLPIGQYNVSHAKRMKLLYPYILAGACGVKNDIMVENNINLLGDFIKIIRTQQDDIIKYTYKGSLDKFNYGTDEVILNLAMYRYKRNFDFFIKKQKTMVILLKRFSDTRAVLFHILAMENPALFSLFEKYKISAISSSKEITLFIREKNKNLNIVNDIYNAIDKYYNNYQFNYAWYDIILAYN